MAKLYLGLGSNIGDRRKNITDATLLCGTLIGTLEQLSSLYDTEPWGFDSPNRFLNAAIRLDTDKEPGLCLAMVKAIEQEMGRVYPATTGYADRIIDIDILLYDDLVIAEEKLIIPHPFMADREFVLMPLVEIAPELKHPVTGIPIKELLYLIRN